MVSGEVDGEWEHTRGLSIETTDNPGWWVKIDVDRENQGGTCVLEVVGNPPSEDNGFVGGADWMICQVKNGKFDGAGDPRKLSAILRCFREKVVQETIEG